MSGRSRIVVAGTLKSNMRGISTNNISIEYNSTRILWCRCAKLFKLGFIASFCASIINPAHAEPPEDEEPVTLDTVVTTAEKLDTPYQTGDVDTETTPAFHSVIQREEFEDKTEDLGEVLEKEASVQVRQSAGLGSYSVISIRGSTDRQVKVFLDGIPLNAASDGSLDLSNFSLSDVDSIEVYRGTTPINFSDSSMGGVVNIRTLRSKGGMHLNLGGGYGSFNTVKLFTNVDYKPSDWDYLFSSDYIGSDNDYLYYNDNNTQFNPDDDVVERRNNADFYQANTLVKTGYDFSDTLRVDLTHQWFRKNQGFPSWRNQESARTALHTHRNITNLKLTIDEIRSYPINIATRLDHSHTTDEYRNLQGHMGLGGPELNRYVTSSVGGNFFLEWLYEINTLSFAVDGRHESYTPRLLLNERNPRGSERNSFNLGIQDTLALFSETLHITPAARLTYIQDQIRSGVSQFGAIMEGISQDEIYFTAQIGTGYVILDWLTLKSNLGNYKREPTFDELFGGHGLLQGNAEIKAESGINFDAGFEIDWSLDNSIWIQGITCSSAYFRKHMKDLIIQVSDAQGISQAQNMSTAEIQGVEGSINLHLFKYISFTVNGLLQDSTNHNQQDAMFDGKKVPGVFHKSFSARITSRYEEFKIYVESVFEQGLFYDPANLFEAEEKNEFNAGLSWALYSFLFNFYIKNITNDRYEDFKVGAFRRYASPGVSYYGTLKYSFDKP